jgi:hypothetical protein
MMRAHGAIRERDDDRRSPAGSAAREAAGPVGPGQNPAGDLNGPLAQLDGERGLPPQHRVPTLSVDSRTTARAAASALSALSNSRSRAFA